MNDNIHILENINKYSSSGMFTPDEIDLMKYVAEPDSNPGELNINTPRVMGFDSRRLILIHQALVVDLTTFEAKPFFSNEYNNDQLQALLLAGMCLSPKCENDIRFIHNPKLSMDQISQITSAYSAGFSDEYISIIADKNIPSLVMYGMMQLVKCGIPSDFLKCIPNINITYDHIKPIYEFACSEGFDMFKTANRFKCVVDAIIDNNLNSESTSFLLSLLQNYENCFSKCDIVKKLSNDGVINEQKLKAAFNLLNADIPEGSFISLLNDNNYNYTTDEICCLLQEASVIDVLKEYKSISLSYEELKDLSDASTKNKLFNNLYSER